MSTRRQQGYLRERSSVSDLSIRAFAIIKSRSEPITQRPRDGRPLLVIAARYFFRRAVEEVPAGHRRAYGVLFPFAYPDAGAAGTAELASRPGCCRFGRQLSPFTFCPADRR